MQDAIDAASKAFPAWEHTPAAVKRGIFLKAAELIQTDTYKEKIKQSIRNETAGNDLWVFVNTMATSNNLREAASLASTIKGESFPSSANVGGYCVVQRRAYGVA